MLNKLYHIIYIVFVAVVFVSCTIESKLTKEYFAEKRKKVSVLLMKPEYLFKKNLKYIDTVQTEPNDSVGLANSSFIKDIDDSLFIDAYCKSLIEELSVCGIRVYLENNSEFLKNADSLAYIFTLAQTELEEYIIPIVEDAYIDTNYYSENVELNAVSFNSWFEVSHLNNNNAKNKIVYVEHTANDVYSGRFRKDYFSGNVTYKYKRENIKVDDLYSLASYSGRINAEYIFDYIMNDYMQTRFKSLDRYGQIEYLHYNRYNNKIYLAGQNKFTIVKNEK